MSTSPFLGWTSLVLAISASAPAPATAVPASPGEPGVVATSAEDRVASSTPMSAQTSVSPTTQQVPTFRREIAATVEEADLGDGVFLRTRVQPRHDFFTLWPPRGAAGEPESILLEQIFRSQERTDQEGGESVLEVTAWRSSPGGRQRYDSKVWTFTAPAAEAGFLRWGELYRTVEYGCCAAENVQRLYDLASGALLATSTADPVVVEVPNTPVRRIVAYHSLNGTTPPPEVGEERLSADLPRFLGVLTLTGLPAVERRVAVLEAGPPTADGFADREAFSPALSVAIAASPEETGAWVSLWAAEENPVPSNLGGYCVELGFGFDEPETVIIPVVGDDFDLAGATLPPTLRLVRLR